MADRLLWIKQPPQRWLDWSPLLGGVQGHQKVQSIYPQAQVELAGEGVEAAQRLLSIGHKRGWNPLKWLSASKPASSGDEPAAELLWANMALHLYAQPRALLADWRARLRVGGFLMFSCLGPDTLRELRAVYAACGWPAPSHDFTDMHDWGDMMVEVGFAEPVMDMERITLAYESAERLLQDLRDWGRNLHTGRFAGCRGRQWRAALVKALEQHLPRNDAGQMVLTIEVIYGHAYRAAPKVRLEGESAISVQDMRAMLRQPRSQ